MKINKVLNNNVVVTTNQHGQEIVVMGKGLAFQKKVGQRIDEDKIEKNFVLQDTGTSEKLNQLLQDTSDKYLDIASEIYEYARSILPYKLNDYLYIALTDHISFAITRMKEGIQLKNTLLFEIRKYYKKEFDIGLHSLDIIEEYTGIRMNEDEAASIALHLINSQLSGENMEMAVQVTDVVNKVLNIVKYHYKTEIDENSINYERFLTHLRFFTVRFLREEHIEETIDEFFYEQVQSKYHQAYKCTEKIATFLEKNFNWVLTKDDMVYLTIHIHRVTYRQRKTN
ncbi:PRD domain-containing protein [Gracilibacillus salitolerans]|uniref:PRD domain-containing protein n=1 Tax=Gracilibacillus salitolerans TaxID=2663022 RepID=A0A5Q2TVD4_9BACI|nr:PRD domain-containing protein [Gracilibacillus salitolerans]QGH36788.1 PRD domain-containing protein [Gracilibacillus salitolerans]